MPAPQERGTQRRHQPRRGIFTKRNLQASKILALHAAYRKREASTPRDEAPSAGQIRSLGLLEASDAEKNVKHGSLLPSFGSNNPKGAEGKA